MDEKTLHQNVNIRLPFKNIMRRKRQKSPFFSNYGARGLSELSRKKLIWTKLSNQSWFEMADTQFDEQQWCEKFRVKQRYISLYRAGK